MSIPMLPAELSHLSAGRWTAITLGQSDAAVWRIEGLPQAAFLKAQPSDPLSELPGEARRLEWLSAAGVPAPRLLDFRTVEGTDWLLMTAAQGVDLATHPLPPDQLCAVLATALRTLHRLDVASCPFDHRLEQRLAAAAANAAAGKVDESDFDEARADWTAAQVVDWLRANRPESEDLVVTHGDACLPNIMASDGRFTGIIDCGRIGVADRWQDLALACRSLRFNGSGDEHVASFLAAYGAEWDEARYRYYCTLDELF